MKYDGQFSVPIDGGRVAVRSYEIDQFLMFERDLVLALEVWNGQYWVPLHYHPGALHADVRTLFKLGNFVSQVYSLAKRRPGANPYFATKSLEAIIAEVKDRAKYPVEGYYDFRSPAQRHINGKYVKGEIRHAPDLFSG